MNVLFCNMVRLFPKTRDFSIVSPVFAVEAVCLVGTLLNAFCLEAKVLSPEYFVPVAPRAQETKRDRRPKCMERPAIPKLLYPTTPCYTQPAGKTDAS